MKSLADARKGIFCGVCGTPLVGRMHVDPWGNHTCARHEEECRTCSACHRLISPRSTGGGATYRDGRDICNICRNTAIDTKEEAKPYVNAVAAWMYRHGFRFENLALKINLVDCVSLNSMAHNPLGTTQGLIQKVYKSNGYRYVSCVTVLEGLPNQLMQGVFAHELGHAWLFLERIEPLTIELEEGFCEILAYLYHRESGTKDGEVYMQMIEQRNDPIYGGGFRAMRTAIRSHTFPAIIEHLRVHQTLPS